MSSTDYDYLNARVRAMGSELLTAEFYEQILAVEGEGPLVDFLLGSPYGPQLREALTVRQGLSAAESAIGRNLYATFRKVLSIAPVEPRGLLAIQLNLWDTANVLALVRGKVAGADPEEIREGLFPVGELDEVQLAELASQPSLMALANSLTTWSYSFAFILRRAILDAASGELADLEMSITEAYYRWARSELASEDPDVVIARRMLQMQIDLANVKGALDRVRRRMRHSALGEPTMIPGGTINPRTLDAIGGSSTLVDAFSALDRTLFAPGVERGILAFGRAQNLGVMERFLEQVVISAGCRLYRRDPLSLAVPLGYLWRKYSEFLNLRTLMRGRSYQMPANAIREEMLIA